LKPFKKISLFIIGIALIMSVFQEVYLNAETQTNAKTFVCENEGSGLSAIDVLESTENHTLFLDYFSRYDAEGYEILKDPLLSDKTIWAPNDEAFRAVEDELSNMSDAEMAHILGFHISPPLSRPNGEYPIITFEYLKDQESLTFRTRTGVLSGDDHRLDFNYQDETYLIEGIFIEDTAYCNEAGSVFSIDEVIMDVEAPSFFVWLWYRLVRILLYEDIRFIIYSTVFAFALGGGIPLYLSKRKVRIKS